MEKVTEAGPLFSWKFRDTGWQDLRESPAHKPETGPTTAALGLDTHQPC